MFTACPSCNTIFKLTEENLRTHQGVVRCGRCREVFNASWNLIDTLPEEESRNSESTSDADGRPGLQEGLLERGETEASAGEIEPHGLTEPLDAIEPAVDVSTGSVGDITETEGHTAASSQIQAEDGGEIEPRATNSGEEGAAAPPDVLLREDQDAAEDVAWVEQAPLATPQVGSEIGTPADILESEISLEGEGSGAATPAESDDGGSEVGPGGDSSDQQLWSGLTTEELNFLESRMDPNMRPLEVEDVPAPTAKLARDQAAARAGGADDADTAEEITVEAPFSTLNIEQDTAGGQAGAAAGHAAGLATPAGDQADDSAGSGDDLSSDAPAEPAREWRRITVPQMASDVRLVEIPYPQPIKAAAWALAALFLVLGMIWQTREFYLEDLAEVSALRQPLVKFCEYLSCSVPPRTDIKSIDLVNTSVDPHPITPGALRVSAYLVNRADFVQPFPPLEVTLTDKEGNVVGRRTFQPHEYHVDMSKRMAPNVIERTDFDLAQPAESAVGYEIQLVAR